PQAERQAEGSIGEDQSEMRVGQPEKTHGYVKWNDDHDRREHVGEENKARDHLPPMETKAREAVGSWHRNKQGQSNGGERHDKTVAEISKKARLREQPPEIVEGDMRGPERRRGHKNLARRL